MQYRPANVSAFYSFFFINNTIHRGVIQTDLLSDHYPDFCVLSKNVRFLNQKPATPKQTYKDYTNSTPESFKSGESSSQLRWFAIVKIEL